VDGSFCKTQTAGGGWLALWCRGDMGLVATEETITVPQTALRRASNFCIFPSLAPPAASLGKNALFALLM
jgi:hypothetical protein